MKLENKYETANFKCLNFYTFNIQKKKPEKKKRNKIKEQTPIYTEYVF